MQKFSPTEYLKIDIANSFGLDKQSWNERLNWFEANESDLDSLISQAEEEALFYAGVQAYRATLRNEPIGYPISLDATASGTQILALLSGCRDTAKLCNVVDTGSREDAYTILFNEMDIPGVSRKDAKQAIMTSFYGSLATPRNLLPAKEDLHRFYEVLSTKAKGAYNLNEMLQSLQDPNAESYNWTMPDGFEVKIKVKNSVKEDFTFFGDTHTATYKVVGPTDYDRSTSPNLIHSIDGMIVRELNRRCNYDMEMVQKVIKLLFSQNQEIDTYTDSNNLDMVAKLWNLYVDTGYLSARILDHLDEETVTLVDPMTIFKLIESLPEKPFDILAIHDCFRVLPSYGNDLREQYNLQLYLLGKSNLLNTICSEITGEDFHIRTISSFSKDEILNTNYALS